MLLSLLLSSIRRPHACLCNMLLQPSSFMHAEELSLTWVCCTLQGGTQEGYARWELFRKKGLDLYAAHRNNAMKRCAWGCCLVEPIPGSCRCRHQALRACWESGGELHAKCRS